MKIFLKWMCACGHSQLKHNPFTGWCSVCGRDCQGFHKTEPTEGSAGGGERGGNPAPTEPSSDSRPAWGRVRDLEPIS